VCGTFVCNAIFPSPFSCHSLFLSCFKDGLKATVLTWCLDNGSVTHTYLVEMRRLARDETCFFSTVQPRETTLAWWRYDGNVIPLDTYDHDRSTRDETFYPLTNPLSILSFYSCGSPFSLQISVSLLSWGTLG
jgi:hypothetical protein